MTILKFPVPTDLARRGLRCRAVRVANRPYFTQLDLADLLDLPLDAVADMEAGRSDPRVLERYWCICPDHTPERGV